MNLVIEGLRKRLGGRQVLDGANLCCATPGVVALLGENGSGKSTLLRIVAGVLVPDAGRVCLDGQPLGDDPAGRAARAQIGYVPEVVDVLPHLTVAELLGLTAALRGRASQGESVDRRALDLEPLWHRRMGALSLGQRRRACLAAALVGRPRYLLLDEPTNGLDTAHLAGLLEVLRTHVGEGGGVLVATHDLGFASSLASRRVQMLAGTIVDVASDGGPARIEDHGDGDAPRP